MAGRAAAHDVLVRRYRALEQPGIAVVQVSREPERGKVCRGREGDVVVPLPRAQAFKERDGLVAVPYVAGALVLPQAGRCLPLGRYAQSVTTIYSERTRGGSPPQEVYPGKSDAPGIRLL
jgi:hypothetical protein